MLPFDNLSGDTDQEYFSDGMAEDLITDLSKLSSLRVMARNSSFSFKGQMADIKDIAEKLGVSFVLEGSVRRMGDKVRINAQLVDGKSGHHIWADRYDGALAEIFDFQDRIRMEIVTALKVNLTPQEVARVDTRRTNNIEAYDHYLKGRECYFKYTPDAWLEAIRYLGLATKIDPNFAEAYAYIAACHTGFWIFQWSDRDDELDEARKMAERAVALAPNSPIAVTRLAWLDTWERRFDDAQRGFDKAVGLAPNLAEVFTYKAQFHNFAGDIIADNISLEVSN